MKMNSLDKFLAIICALVVLGALILTIIALVDWATDWAPGNRDMDKLPHVNTPR